MGGEHLLVGEGCGLEEGLGVVEGSIGDVLEDVGAFDHALEGLVAENLLYLRVQPVIVDEVGFSCDLVHEAFHDVVGLFLAQGLHWFVALMRHLSFVSACFGLHLTSIFFLQRSLDYPKCTFLRVLVH